MAVSPSPPRPSARGKDTTSPQRSGDFCLASDGHFLLATDRPDSAYLAPTTLVRYPEMAGPEAASPTATMLRRAGRRQRGARAAQVAERSVVCPNIYGCLCPQENMIPVTENIAPSIPRSPYYSSSEVILKLVLNHNEVMEGCSWQGLTRLPVPRTWSRFPICHCVLQVALPSTLTPSYRRSEFN